MSENVVGYRPVEMIFVDPSPLQELSRDRGFPRAELIANTAMEEIAERLSVAEAAWNAGEFARLGKVARSIVGPAEELGLETLAYVAGSLASEVRSQNSAALAALVDRQTRVGEASLSALWDLGHLRL